MRFRRRRALPAASTNHYRVYMQSPVDRHQRVVTVASKNENEAVALAELREREFSSFDLNDQECRNLYKLPSDYTADFVTAHCRRLEDGRIVGPNKVMKGHFQAHITDEPYRVVSVEQFDPLWSLIEQAKQMQGNPADWERALAALKDAGIPLAVVTGTLYGLTAQGMIDGSAAVAWTTDTIKTALTTSTYVPNQDTDHFFSSVTNEITGTGYTAGGLTLGTKTSTYDTATNTIRLDAADAAWTSSTLTARIAVVYKSTGVGTTSPVLGWVDFGADETTSSGTLTITWDATGVIVYNVT